MSKIDQKIRFFAPDQDVSLFLHCIDSRVEENGSWYTRLHIGPFWPGSRLQVRTRLRRSLMNDLIQTSITAIKFEGAVHEFSRLPGIHESILDILFQFRKIVIYDLVLQLGETILVSFLFYGPGVFYAKDIPWPNGIQSRNPSSYLVTIAPGSILRGRILIQKGCVNLISKTGRSICFGEPFHSQYPVLEHEIRKFRAYPWISVGFPINQIDRVGFRLESRGPLNQQHEIVIFEILTNGRISPRQALHESATLLVHKFLAISNVTLPFYIEQSPSQVQVNINGIINQKSYTRNEYTINKTKKLEEKFYDLFMFGFYRFREPLGLDLRNLDLTKEVYVELQILGIATLGQLLEGLVFESYNFSPFLRKQRQHAMLHLGIFPF